jgi:hypothetical protein
LNFLVFNNRGHDCLSEAYRTGQVVYVGGSIEDFTECILDIAAAVRFAKELGDEVMLQGHSHGCEKVLHYVQTTSAGHPIVLLSPSDSYQLHRRYLAQRAAGGESVEQQIARLKTTYTLSGWEWLPEGEYGIATDHAAYEIPSTAASLHGLMDGPAFQILRLDIPWRGERLANPAWAYLGGQDPLQIDGPLRMSHGLHQRLANAKVVVAPGGDHHMRPVQHEVITSLTAWIALNDHGMRT